MDLSFEKEDKSRQSDEIDKAIQVLTFMVEDILDGECRIQDLAALNKVSLFLGHGEKDEVVPLQLGQRLANTLQSLNFQVQ